MCLSVLVRCVIIMLASEQDVTISGKRVLVVQKIDINIRSVSH